MRSPILAVIVFLVAYAVPTTTTGADTPAPPDPAMTNNVRPDAAGMPPLIIQNPDGTMTIQKEPTQEKTEDAGQKGLVIPPQVVVPTLRKPTNDQRDQDR